ncbi:COBRA, plant [Sesbania bispinosa]|nr:COBRA, plant [Sesbania bispinosa]
MNNFQKYCHIASPGWSLGWTWAKQEVIWNMMGGMTTEQGDCSKFKGNIPHSCKKDPTVVDLLPGTPYNQRVPNCCKGGILSSWLQDPTNAVASFQVNVVGAGTTDKTIKVPKNFTLKASGPGYTCGPAKIVRPTKFITQDKRRVTQALNKPYLAPIVSGFEKNKFSPLVQCTSHMCPIQINWRVKLNYKEYWRVKVTITNLNYHMNYSEWNLVVQDPNFDNMTQSFSWNYKTLTPYDSITGPNGNVQAEIVFRKDKENFTYDKGWAFPQRIYFNGDNCLMPPPDAYPWFPINSSSQQEVFDENSTQSHISGVVEKLKASFVKSMIFTLAIFAFYTIM